MIVTQLDQKHGVCSVVPESSDDLWALRRLLRRGDTLVTRSSRVMKREEEYARPDKGERVTVTIELSVTDVHLDSSIERLRVGGTIIATSDEEVSRGGSHSVTLSAGHPLTIRRDRFSPLEVRLLREEGAARARFLLVAADRREAGVGTLSGSHLSVVATVESGLGGKMSAEQNAGPYVSKVVSLVSASYRDGDVPVVAGPGTWKSSLANQIGAALKRQVRVVEGFDLTGADGIRLLVKDPAFQELAKGSAAVEMQKLVSEVVRRVASGDGRVAYSLPRVKEAAAAGAVEACAVSDDVFSAKVDEQEVVDTLNAVEEKGGSVYLADSSMEFGRQIAAFGGIVSVLRYALKAC